MFSRCFPLDKHGEAEPDMISAIRLQILVNDVRTCRKIMIKGLYGDHDMLKTFISDFKIKLITLVKAPKRAPH
jgi:hypothetical protein